jgi:hypothetical protein
MDVTRFFVRLATIFISFHQIVNVEFYADDTPLNYLRFISLLLSVFAYTDCLVSQSESHSLQRQPPRVADNQQAQRLEWDRIERPANTMVTTMGDKAPVCYLVQQGENTVR